MNTETWHYLRANLSECDRIRIFPLLSKIARRSGEGNVRRRLLERRRSIKRMIAQCAEDGKVLAVESGRDCDCVEYWGKTHLIDASYEAYSRLDTDLAEWTDGPYRLEIARPSEIEQIRDGAGTHDLITEAWENGESTYHLLPKYFHG